MLALVERLKKKDAPGNSYKNTTENISFFNREQVFIGIHREVVTISNTTNYHCCISKVRENKLIDKCFLRHKFFALNDQFD